MIESSYNYFAFFTYRTRNRTNCRPERFLDEDDIEVFVDFQYYISKNFVFSYILQKYFEIF